MSTTRAARGPRRPLTCTTLVGCLLVALLLGSCSRSVVLAEGASREAGVLMGSSSVRTVELTGDDVGRLAASAQVSEEEITRLAPHLDTQSNWQRAVSASTRLQQQSRRPLGKVAVGVACDGLNGTIRSEDDLQMSIVRQAGGLLTGPESKAVVDASRELYDQLVVSANSKDPQVRASVALTCFAVQRVQ